MKSSPKIFYLKYLKSLIILLCISFCYDVASQIRTPSEIDISQITVKKKSETTYYFDEFLTADIKFRNSKRINRDQINLDVLEQQVDIKRGNDIYTIDSKDMEYAVIDKVDSLQKVIILSEANAFNIFFYRGKKYSIVNIPTAKHYKKSYNAPGETNKTKIILKNSYRIIESEKTHKISLNNKSVIKALGDGAEKIIKASKIKIKTLEDLVSVLRELEK